MLNFIYKIIINVIIFVAIFGYNKCDCNNISIVLDIAFPNNYINVVTYATECSTRLRYTPIDGCIIVKVTDKQQLLWEANNNNVKCLGVSLYRHINKDMFIHFEIDGAEPRYIYFSRPKEESQWTSISYIQYSRGMNRLLFERRFNLQDDTNYIAFKSQVITEFGNHIYSFRIIPSFFLSEIVDGPISIWNSINGEICKKLIISCIRQEHYLLSLYIKSGSNMYNKYYVKIPTDRTIDISQRDSDSKNEELIGAVGGYDDEGPSTSYHHAHATTVGPGVRSTSYLSPMGRTAHGDRRDEDDDVSSSGSGEPEADLREAEGEVNEGAVGGDIEVPVDDLERTPTASPTGEGPMMDVDMPVRQHSGAIAYDDDDNNVIPEHITYLWDELTEEEYKRLSIKVEKEYKLDIENEQDLEKFAIYYHHPYGTKSIIFTPKDEIYISKVVAGEFKIWESNDLTKQCIDTTVYLDESGDKVLVQLFISSNSLYGFHYFRVLNEGSWIEIEDKDFYEILNNLDQSYSRKRKKS